MLFNNCNYEALYVFSFSLRVLLEPDDTFWEVFVFNVRLKNEESFVEFLYIYKTNNLIKRVINKEFVSLM